MTSPQLRLVPPTSVVDEDDPVLVGCFDLQQLSEQIADAMSAVDDALSAERSRYRSVQLTRARIMLHELHSTVNAIRE